MEKVADQSCLLCEITFENESKINKLSKRESARLCIALGLKKSALPSIFREASFCNKCKLFINIASAELLVVVEKKIRKSICSHVMTSERNMDNEQGPDSQLDKDHHNRKLLLAALEANLKKVNFNKDQSSSLDTSDLKEKVDKLTYSLEKMQENMMKQFLGVQQNIENTLQELFNKHRQQMLMMIRQLDQ